MRLIQSKRVSPGLFFLKGDPVILRLLTLSEDEVRCKHVAEEFGQSGRHLMMFSIMPQVPPGDLMDVLGSPLGFKRGGSEPGLSPHQPPQVPAEGEPTPGAPRRARDHRFCSLLRCRLGAVSSPKAELQSLPLKFVGKVISSRT